MFLFQMLTSESHLDSMKKMAL